MNYTYSQFKHGQKVTCVIEGTKITDAKISINKGSGNVYICQDKKNGANADDKLGYQYSWFVCSRNINFTEGKEHITNLNLFGGEKEVTMKNATWGISYMREIDPVEFFTSRSKAEKRIAELMKDKDVSDIWLFAIGKKYKATVPVAYELVEEK